MTNNQVKWASRHDWFISARDGVVTCLDVCLDCKTGVVKTKQVAFNDFEALKAWAGY